MGNTPLHLLFPLILLTLSLGHVVLELFEDLRGAALRRIRRLLRRDLRDVGQQFIAMLIDVPRTEQEEEQRDDRESTTNHRTVRAELVSAIECMEVADHNIELVPDGLFFLSCFGGGVGVYGHVFQYTISEAALPLAEKLERAREAVRSGKRDVHAVGQFQKSATEAGLEQCDAGEGVVLHSDAQCPFRIWRDGRYTPEVVDVIVALHGIADCGPLQ